MDSGGAIVTGPKGKGSSVRTLDLKPGFGEIIKPVELIDIRGATELTLSARRLYNVLLAHAFGPDLAAEGREFTIEISALKGTHESNDRLHESILALMRTIVTVRRTDGSIDRVALLGGNTLASPARDRGAFTYSFDPRLGPLLRDSTVFGKLEVAVMHAFTTKYALALYEALSRRVRLSSVFSEVFELDDFRDLLGVPRQKLGTFSNLKLKAITPAVAEINAMASFGCSVDPVKTGRKVTAVRVGWWRKDIHELKAAYVEIQRSKVGRKARMAGRTDAVVDPDDQLH